jgi:ferredoxin-NADP reductase
VVAVRRETPSARTLVLDVPDWPGHLAGQHVDIRLTAEDGYMAQRSFSIASAADSTHVELTVQSVSGGEVSTYLVDEVRPGDQMELRGPIGGYFIWRSEQQQPVLLLAGGSGLVPLMSMIRTRSAAGAATPMRLIYSVRSVTDVLYAAELRDRADHDVGLTATIIYTRGAPDGSPRPAGRIDAAVLSELAWRVDGQPLNYLCGPTAFVERMADLLVAAGHPPVRIRTERFG